MRGLPDQYHIEPVAWPIDLLSCVRAFSRGRSLVWLDSGVGQGPFGGFSVVACAPCERISKTLGWDDGARPSRTSSRTGFLEALSRRIRRRPLYRESRFPLGPGWFGFLGFELADELERLPPAAASETPLTLARMERHERVIVLDAAKRTAYSIATAEGQIDRALYRAWIRRWNDAAALEPNLNGLSVTGSARVRFDQTRSEYLRRIERVKRYVAAGDIYQVNLAQRLRIRGLDDPLAFFGRLRTANPAAFGALVRWRGGAMASASPELFLRLRGAEIQTRPIKGTRPRTGDARHDALARKELLASEKDAAELAMIVDLHRNDLGRVCEPGSVRVVSPRDFEAHATVIHTLADVRGRLRAGCDALDVIRACFPAGSISGVPKIRAMEIIRKLEPCPRGVYTGAIGAIGADGQMTLSVAIRTVQFVGDEVHLHVGGGIVADSDPTAEYDETLAKARGILRAAGAEEALAR